MGVTESFEPVTSNLYTRKVLSGEFDLVNKYLVADLEERGLWHESMMRQIMAHGGSVQDIPGFPEELKPLYKTVWEIKQRALIDMSADRGPFVCQSQSMNLYFRNPTTPKMSGALFHAWRRGLKTGCYYMRTRAAIEAVSVTNQAAATQASRAVVCNDDVCTACSA